MSAPERIWAAPGGDDWLSGSGEWDVSALWAVETKVEYIHADIHAARIADLERQLAVDAKAHEKEIAVWSENYAALERQIAEARTDAEQAVALAYQRACEPVEANFPGTLYASNRTKAIAAILALAPADALAEVERLKAERDGLRHFNRQLRDAITECQMIRDDLAAEVARLTGEIGELRKDYYSAKERLAEYDRAALTTPEKDATK